jgi:ankyrin repeat protein
MMNRELIVAIKHYKLENVRSLLAAGADPNTRNTPERQVSLLQRLKELIHPPPPDLSATALIIACRQRRFNNTIGVQTPEMVKALLASGADINAVDDAGYTPITALLYDYGPAESAASLQVLVSAGANIEVQNVYMAPPLAIATQFEHHASMRILLDHGANIEALSGDQETPLMLACGSGLTESARILLERGASPNARSQNMGTPLSLARQNGHSDIVRLLKAHGTKE